MPSRTRWFFVYRLWYTFRWFYRLLFFQVGRFLFDAGFSMLVTGATRSVGLAPTPRKVLWEDPCWRIHLLVLFFHFHILLIPRPLQFPLLSFIHPEGHLYGWVYLGSLGREIYHGYFSNYEHEHHIYKITLPYSLFIRSDWRLKTVLITVYHFIEMSLLLPVTTTTTEKAFGDTENIKTDLLNKLSVMAYWWCEIWF